MRAGNQRCDFIQSNRYFLIIGCICVSGKLYPILAASLCVKEFLCHLVRREYGCSCAQLCAHVCDGCSLGNGKRLYAFTCVFHHLADTAFNGQAAQYLKNNVLRGYPGGKLACQVHTANLGHSQIIGTAAHGNGYIQTACANRKHPDATACRGVAVRAKQGFAGLAEALQMHLMTDAVAGLGEINPMLACHCLDIFMVICVFKACLQGVVVDVSNRFLCFDTGNPNGFKLQIRHGACGVLCQCLVDFDGDFLPCHHFTGYQMVFNQFFGNIHSHILFLLRKLFDEVLFF